MANPDGMVFLADQYIGVRIQPATETVALDFATAGGGHIAVTIPAVEFLRLYADARRRIETNALLQALVSKKA